MFTIIFDLLSVIEIFFYSFLGHIFITFTVIFGFIIKFQRSLFFYLNHMIKIKKSFDLNHPNPFFTQNTSE